MELVDHVHTREEKADLSWPYVRSATGEWEYEWGGVVPGARDLRLSDRYSFPEEDLGAGRKQLLLPLRVWQADPALAWCAAYWEPRARDEVIRVPKTAWEAHDEVTGMTAPELHHLLDTAAVAQMVGCRPNTITVYLAKGHMPQPVFRFGGSPTWPEPLIRHWLETRPGKAGRPSSRGGRRMSKSSGGPSRQASSGPEELVHLSIAGSSKEIGIFADLEQAMAAAEAFDDQLHL